MASFASRTLFLSFLISVAFAQAPASCKLDTQCTKNQYCNTESSSECEALLKTGDRCIKNSWCESKNCMDIAKCAADPRPMFSPELSAALKAGGAECTADNDCMKYQYCNTKSSLQCELLLKLGDRCIKDSWCVSKNCLDTFKCSADPKPFGDIGSDPIAAEKSPPPAYSYCEVDAQCTAGEVCDTTISQCVPPSALRWDHRCNNNRWCANFIQLVEGIFT